VWRVACGVCLASLQSVKYNPRHVARRRSCLSTLPSVSQAADVARRRVRDVRDAGRYGPAHARTAVGVRCCGAESTAGVCLSWHVRSLSKRVGFSKCVSCSLRLGFILLFASSRVVWSCYGLWQVQVGEIVGRRPLVGYDVKYSWAPAPMYREPFCRARYEYTPQSV